MMNKGWNSSMFCHVGGGPEESLNNCESSGHLYTGSQRGEDKAENLSGWITQNN